MMLGHSAVVADIGGTNARFACVKSDSPECELVHVMEFRCSDFPSLDLSLQHYISSVQRTIGDLSITHVCLALAAPVENDQIAFLNNPWNFSARLLRQQLQAKFGAKLLVINDFTAQVLALEVIKHDDLCFVTASSKAKKPDPAEGVIAVLGAGTGLGMSARFPDGAVLPSEGGHAAFAPSNDHELELLRLLWQRYERVSVERLLSGQGLENLYWANAVLNNREHELSALEISQGAVNGEIDCLRAVSDFSNILGSVAGDLALVAGAKGGVYIAGGIVPKLLPLLDLLSIRSRFNAKGRYHSYCAEIPLAIVLADQPGLLGCVQALKSAGL